MGPLVQPLFDGPIDVVGDVHGEAGQLCALLFRLGYDGRGRHPEGRRLVFVGDLTDRGPDSPGVLRIVRALVESGVAQMVLGNHELNLLKGEKKHGNHWYWGEGEQLCRKSKDASQPILRPDDPSFQMQLDGSEDAQTEAVAFVRKQPLVLERPGELAIVHAMYDPASVEALRAFEGDAAAADDHFQARCEARLATFEEREGRTPSSDDKDMIIQNENPVKVLTSGMEVPAAEPFFAGGKMRTLQRYRWWEEYNGAAGLVVIGHYWRRRPAAVDLGFEATGPSLFPDESASAGSELGVLGPKRAVACVDYSAGLRYEERGRGLVEGSLGTALAALRLPERTLHFADGEVTPLR
eukprot:TRINITY_DN12731_c0_g1_i1.p1 TRINITY_DN12731_c0_g1~~TRINITY_DN12731_c0_g1_i1.p1  ORF type:complete len:387 (-),score=90.90 TRINITY_DN12731_c0_g1_i1:396-1454(-)